MALIEIPRANDYTLSFSLDEGASSVTKVFFTLKPLDDISQTDDDATVSKDLVSPTDYTITGDTLEGTCILSHDDTDIPEGIYKYDFKLVGASKFNNTNKGLIEITDRVTVRET